MKYKIQRAIAGCPADGWVQSDSFPGIYSAAEAKDIVEANKGAICYRLVPEFVKPYRRHAAVTPLELRGAIAMLKSACAYIANTGSAAFQGYSILYDARIKCARHLGEM